MPLLSLVFYRQLCYHDQAVLQSYFHPAGSVNTNTQIQRFISIPDCPNLSYVLLNVLWNHCFAIDIVTVPKYESVSGHNCDMHYTLNCDMHYTLNCDMHYTSNCDMHYTLNCDMHYTLNCDMHYTLNCDIHYTLNCDMHWLAVGHIKTVLCCQNHEVL